LFKLTTVLIEKGAANADEWLGIKNNATGVNPPVLYDHTAVVVGGLMIVYGGTTEEGVITDETWHWKINDNTWEGPIETTGTSPGSRSGATAYELEAFLMVLAHARI
jgi:hypothetical protein